MPKPNRLALHARVAAAVLHSLAVAFVAATMIWAPAMPAAAQAPGSAGQSAVKAGSLLIEAPWIRATPQGAKVAGGYVKITNTGQQPDRLTGGSLPIASAIEVHEVAMADGVMKMRMLPNGLEIAPGQTIELKPGGYHLMIMGLKEGVKEGALLKGTLIFEKAGPVELEFAVRPIGAQSGAASQPQGGGQMNHMNHMKH